MKTNNGKELNVMKMNETCNFVDDNFSRKVLSIDELSRVFNSVPNSNVNILDVVITSVS